MIRITHWKVKLLVSLLVLAWLAVIAWFRLPCLFRMVLGLPCPGCGMTRAWLAVLRLDWRAAFHYNPLFWSVPILYLYVVFDGHPFPRLWQNRGFLIAMLVAALVLEVVRLAVPSYGAIVFS